MPHLAVTQLQLTNFRNYEQHTLTATDGPVVITGPNGAGKTNILEAISLLTPGRGIRNSKLTLLDRQGPAASSNPFSNFPWSIFSHIRTPEGNITIGTGRDPSPKKDKRIVKINGETARGQTQLAHHFAVCALTPQMDTIFIDGSTSRRNFLDRLVVNFYPDHVRHLSIYNHAKMERSKLLSAPPWDEIWISHIEQRMAEQAIAIAAARIDTLQHLQTTILTHHSAFPKAELTATGGVEQLLTTMPALEAESNYCELLKKSRHNDKQTGRTEHGPHRSDFHVVHEHTRLPAELCSTGEQKAIMITLTLATARAREKWFGSAPVMLLDEVTSHLDDHKRLSFFDELSTFSAQIWMTDTNPEIFLQLPSKPLFLTIEKTCISG